MVRHLHKLQNDKSSGSLYLDIGHWRTWTSYPQNNGEQLEGFLQRNVMFKSTLEGDKPGSDV